MFVLTPEQRNLAVLEGWNIRPNGQLVSLSDAYGNRVFKSIYATAVFLRERAIQGSNFHYEAFLASPWMIYDTEMARLGGWYLYQYSYGSPSVKVISPSVFKEKILVPITPAEEVETELLVEYIAQQAGYSTDPLYMKALKIITKARLLQGT